MKKSQLIDKAKDAKFSPEQLDFLASAIDFATEMHRGQKRKSGEPYIIHPLQVAANLIDWELDIDSIVAGVLHDTVEDTPATLKQIEEKFGRDAAFLVDGVTKLGQLRSGMRDIDSYLPATKDNLTKLLIATGQDIRVMIIKLADRLHNMQTLKFLSPAKQKKISTETLQVFAPVADRLNMGRVRVQLEEISFSYLDHHRYNFLKKQMKKRLGRASKKLDHVRAEVGKKLAENKIDFQMDGRIKSVYSLHKKLEKHDQNFEAIYDLIALRIVVENKADCYQVLGLIHGLYTPMIERIKDYIAQPKSNGYQSLHTTVITPDEQIVEFQIRTERMHEYAERGLAASFHYNEQKLTDAYKKGQISAMPTDLSWITELQTAAARLSAGEEVDTEKLRINLFSDRIFVYSPKGDIYDLPEGALPLDYAYRIHSDIGKNAQNVQVNGKIAKFDQPLKTGDIVEIITRNNIKPSVDWLKRIITPHARTKIRQQLKRLNIEPPRERSKDRKK
ncbi:MAG: RelA/SpoT family protein [Candidatus Nomurabacteria bacterium]|jgi:GTP pyrophosphokinase|nr:RelA/SpoT family protein [Candidatus Nomurabacteria bacterium]